MKRFPFTPRHVIRRSLKELHRGERRSELSASCFIRTKFDEVAFYFAVHCLTDKPAFLGRTVVVRAHARAASIGGDDRVPERTFGEPVKVAAENGLKVQPVTPVK